MHWIVENVRWCNASAACNASCSYSLRLTAIVVCSCILGSCATKYQEMGFSGGVSAQPVMTDVYRIQARGNAYTGSAAVQDFYLLKAAETTLAAGGSHFLIIGAENQTSRSVGQTPGYANTSVVGGTAFMTYTPGATYDIIKPGQDVMVKVLRIRAGETPPQGAFPAVDIVHTIGPRLKTS
jgi:hypothetical protein